MNMVPIKHTNYTVCFKQSVFCAEQEGGGGYIFKGKWKIMTDL